MLQIRIDPQELYDEEKSEFMELPGADLSLEHSLLSLSKWESIFKKPFLDDGEKTTEEILGYIEAMCVEPLEDPSVLQRLGPQHFAQIQDYLQSTMSATTFGEMPSKGGPKEKITSELIYYWMIAYNIPWEAENWHLNRLFALIRICNIKQQQQNGGKQKSKVSPGEAARQRARLNAERRKQLGTTG